MELAVADVALRRGVSPQRVRALAREGRISARRLGGHWLIDPADAVRPPRVSRAMSPRMAWAMCGMLSGVQPSGMDPSEVSRLRARVSKLKSSENPAPQVSSWLWSRAPRLMLSVDASAVAQLREDPRILLSGVSDPRSQLSAAHLVEGYVAPDSLRQLRRDYLMVEGGDVNVYVHVADVAEAMGRDAGVSAAAPLGLVIADLADHQSAREEAQVRRLIAQL